MIEVRPTKKPKPNPTTPKNKGKPTPAAAKTKTPTQAKTTAKAKSKSSGKGTIKGKGKGKERAGKQGKQGKLVGDGELEISDDNGLFSEFLSLAGLLRSTAMFEDVSRSGDVWGSRIEGRTSGIRDPRRRVSWEYGPKILDSPFSLHYHRLRPRITIRSPSQLKRNLS